MCKDDIVRRQKMKKRQFKFKGIVLACCLATAMPLVATTTFEITARADVSAQTVDITTPAGTAESDKGTYIKTQIENALVHNNAVRVIGQVNINDPSGVSTEIIIPDGKKIIWEAVVTKEHGSLISIKTTAGGEADFEMASGRLKAGNTALSILGYLGAVNLTVKGGEIISKTSSAPTVEFDGKGHFNMTGGKIVNNGEYYALRLMPIIDMDYSITGGPLISWGRKNNAEFRSDNDVIELAAPPVVNSNINVDASKTNIICWDIQTYNSRTPLIRYVAGHDSRDIHTYPGSATKVTWASVNGAAAIRYTNPNGDSGTALQEVAAVEDMNFPSITDTVYDKNEHGVDNFTAPDHSNVEFKYKDADGNISSTKPVNAGEYEVITKLSGTYGDLDVSLGKLNIYKRPVTVEVPNKEIKVNEALPNDFSDYTVTNLANGDSKEDAIMSTPTFTWGTDGKSVGEFNISTLSAIAYKGNYKAADTALRGVLKVKAADVNPQTPGTQPQNPGVQPQNPGVQPQNPGVQPQNPGVQPQNPGVQPQNPGTQPQNPGVQPQTPGTQPQNPGAQPQNPGAQPQNPGVQPQNPGAQPRNPGAQPQKPGTQPQNPGTEKNKKTKPSDIVIPDKQNKDAKNKATPSVPKRPENNRSGSGGKRRSGGGSGGGSGRGTNAKSKNKNTNTAAGGTWINDAKGWWYKEQNGSYPKSTWRELSYNGVKNRYYFDEQGYMATGWKLINGKWYYMYEKTDGAHIKGSMAYNTNIGEYKVGSDGAWIK